MEKNSTFFALQVSNCSEWHFWLFVTKNLITVTKKIESFFIVGSGKQVMYADEDFFFLMIRRENFVTTAFRDTVSLETICSHRPPPPPAGLE